MKGYLNTNKGLAQIYPIKNGIITKCNISQGEHIKEGAPLFVINTGYEKMDKELQQQEFKQLQNRDFIIKQEIPFTDVVTTIRTNSPSFLTNIVLLDQYRGESIPKDSTSLCLQLTFQSSEKTLITKEVEDIIVNLQAVLEKIHNVIIRI